MNRSSKLKNILNKRKILWNDSDSDISSLSDQENIIITSDTSSDENNQVSKKPCCLICSILPNLSTINACEKHLMLLTKPRASRKIVYMVPPPKVHCHCELKSKHRRRSSSSSSSLESPPHKKKRSKTLQSSKSSSQSDAYFSPSILSQATINDNQQHRSNHVQSRLSPSLPPSTTNFHNNLQQHNEVLLVPLINKNKKIPDVIELDCDSQNVSSTETIIHVKDDNEILNENSQKKPVLTIAQATEQMLINQYPQPIILLERVCFQE